MSDISVLHMEFKDKECTDLGGLHQIQEVLLVGFGVVMSLIVATGTCSGRCKMFAYAAVDIGLELRYHFVCSMMRVNR